MTKIIVSNARRMVVVSDHLKSFEYREYLKEERRVKRLDASSNFNYGVTSSVEDYFPVHLPFLSHCFFVRLTIPSFIISRFEESKTI